MLELEIAQVQLVDVLNKGDEFEENTQYFIDKRNGIREQILNYVNELIGDE